jgi:hypothetical protein
MHGSRPPLVRDVLPVGRSDAIDPSSRQPLHEVASGARRLGRRRARRRARAQTEGPPYACLENVVDENDMEACSPVPERQS